MKKILIFFLSCVLLLIAFCGEEDEILPLKERYPGYWDHSFDLDITIALATAKTRGCGEYKHKKPAKDSDPYLVRCTRDGENWLTYFVWTYIQEVQGPYLPDPSLD